MCSEQREAVLVLIYLLHRNLPSLYGVALFASSAELPLVNVGVAVGALLSHVREHWFGVALCAGDSLVHAAQRKARLVVIELRQAADGFPSAQRVAVLARHIQRAVRAPRAAVARRLPPSRRWQQEQKKDL